MMTKVRELIKNGTEEELMAAVPLLSFSLDISRKYDCTLSDDEIAELNNKGLLVKGYDIIEAKANDYRERKYNEMNPGKDKDIYFDHPEVKR